MKCTFPSVSTSPCQSLLDEPNPNSPANSQAAQLYQENKREYEKRVSAIVEQSCRDCWPASGPARCPPSVCRHLSPLLPSSLVCCPPPPTKHQKQLSDFSLHALYIHPPLHRIFYFARQKGFTVFLSLRTLNLALTLLRWICGTLLHSELLITQEWLR